MNKDNEFLIDTNCLGKFSGLNQEVFKGWKIFCTSVQIIELNKYENLMKKEVLLQIFNTINPECLISSAGYYGLARYGYCKYGDEKSLDTLSALLDEIQKQDTFEESIGKKKAPNKVNLEANRKGDVLTLHAAIELGPNGVLITSDKALRIVAQRHAVQVMKPSTFIKKIGCSDNDLDQ